MTAIGLAVAVAITWGAADFLAGLASRRLSMLGVLLYSQVFAWVIMVVIAARFGGAPSTGSGALASTLTGIVWIVGILLLYRALTTGAMGVVAPVAATGVLIPVAYGLLRGDSFGVVQVAGAPLCLVGIILAARATGEHPVPQPATPGRRQRSPAEWARNPVVLAALSAVATGAEMVLFARAAETESMVSIVLIQRTMGVAGSVIAIALMRPDLTPTRALVIAGLGVGGLDVAGAAAFVAANQRAAVAIVALLAALFPLVTAGLGRFVLHERLSRLQQAGALLALTGALLLAAGTAG